MAPGRGGNYLMTEPFLISDERLRELSATRQGRVSIAGYNYQAAYAVVRLVSMCVRQPVLELEDWPQRLRYDWGEDLDEVCDGNVVRFTQCKRVDTIGQAALLADVLIGFAPKWLWVPEPQRDRLRFRLACSDPRFATEGSLNSLKANVSKHFLRRLNATVGPQSDRAQWINEAVAMGYGALFEALWSGFDCVYVPGNVVNSDTGGLRLAAEKEALRVLLERGQIVAEGQMPVLERLRRLIHDNLITFDPTNESILPLSDRSPRRLDRADVNAAIDPWRPPTHRQPPFQLVDRTFLSEQRELDRQQFVARQPDWCDVVHGRDETIKFIERDRTGLLEAAVLEKVVARIGRAGKLPTLFVVGAPGEGKTTIARRVAARLVDAGALLIADTGVGLHEPPGEPDEYVQAIERIQSFGRPVVLLLDDPLYAESPWLDVLKKLNRPGLQVGVLAASPQFLFDEHKSELRACDLKTFEMARTSQNERESLAALYGRSLSSKADRDFLVVAMEAAAGAPFNEIIERLWLTLADGRDLSSARILSDLPWQSRAYLFVCFFSRAYEACPEPLLLKLMELTGGVEGQSDVHTELQRMNHFAGWRIFRIDQRNKNVAKYQGATISAAHTVIARQAWEQRPLAWCDLSDAVIEASTSVPETIRDVSRLGVRLKSTSFVGSMSVASGFDFARKLIERWRHELSVETRYVSDLASTFSKLGNTELGRSVREILVHRAVPNSQGWLAALQLWHLNYDLDRQPEFPAEVDLLPLIHSADFSVAPYRAAGFGKAIEANSQARDAFVCRMLDAFDGQLAWKLEGFLLAYLLRIATPDQLSPRLPQIKAWIERHLNSNLPRTGYLTLLSQLPAEFSALRANAAQQTAKWLEEHGEDTKVRRHYLSFVLHLPARFSNLRGEAARQTAKWLEEHGEDTNVRTQYFSFLLQLPAKFSDLRADVARQTANWLEEHSEDNYVRTRYLSFLLKLPDEFRQLRADVAAQTAKWLEDHGEDADVRTQYFSFLIHFPDEFSQLRPDIARQTAKWLEEHCEDTDIRTKFLSFLSEIPYTQTGLGGTLPLSEWQELASAALRDGANLTIQSGWPMGHRTLVMSYFGLHQNLLESLKLHDSEAVRRALRLSHDATEQWFERYPFSSVQYDLPLP
jgi:hypothetical protein